MRHCGSMTSEPGGADPGMDWRTRGVHVVRAGDLDSNTAQTLGMNRAAAITAARHGAEFLWAGTVDIHPGAATGAHHHGPVERSEERRVGKECRSRWSPYH